MGTVQEFFDGLASRVRRREDAGMNNSYLFDIEGAGEWPVKVEDGEIDVDRGRRRGRHDDLDLRGDDEAVIDGEQNPTTAYMTGKLKIKGDMGAAMKLQKLF